MKAQTALQKSVKYPTTRVTAQQ